MGTGAYLVWTRDETGQPSRPNTQRASKEEVIHDIHHTTQEQLSINDSFGWKHHSFADTYLQRQLWIPPRNHKQLGTIKQLQHTGKSMALCGPSGTGTTTLVHALMTDFEKITGWTIMS